MAFSFSFCLVPHGHSSKPSTLSKKISRRRRRSQSCMLIGKAKKKLSALRKTANGKAPIWLVLTSARVFIGLNIAQEKSFGKRRRVVTHDQDSVNV